MNYNKVIDDHYHEIALALKNNDVEKISYYAKLGKLDFCCDYGPHGTAFDYALKQQNYEMIVVLYLAFLSQQNVAQKIIHHPRVLHKFLASALKYYDSCEDDFKREEIKGIINILLDLELINFKFLVFNANEWHNETLIDLASGLCDNDILKTFISHIDFDSLKKNEIKKVVSFEGIAKEISNDRSGLQIKKLMLSGFPYDIIEDVLLHDYYINKKLLHDVMKDELGDIFDDVFS
ncbi:MAG TPA: hypothetical protein QKA08_04765 [Candidatus Megaira endosymbiont of Nemacystus decipiens]|nr:hypothetical protein [Candidatus Megaera endosymbiont of Nemacystus decipiens]